MAQLVWFCFEMVLRIIDVLTCDRLDDDDDVKLPFFFFLNGSKIDLFQSAFIRPGLQSQSEGGVFRSQ